MTNNHLYNLLHQLVNENQSYWHIKKNFFDDAIDCDKCTKFWKKMLADKEDHVKELEELVKEHMA